MISLSNIKLVAVLCITLILGCKKKKTTSSTPEPAQSPTCFNTFYNGNYVGSGFTAATTFTYGTLNVSRSNCQTVSLNLSTNTGVNKYEQASQLVLNSSGNYVGKLSNSNAITISPGGTHVYIVAVGSFTFNGDKQ
jgi:hypothetical protein